MMGRVNATETTQGVQNMELNRKIIKGNERYRDVLKDIHDCILDGFQDLVINITSEEAAAVSLGAIGPEFLLATAVANVQNGAFHLQLPQPSSSLANQANDFVARGRSQRSTVKWVEKAETVSSDTDEDEYVVAQPKPLLTSLMLLDIYAAHFSALEFKASLNPQRRVFLAIRAFEEELRALKQVNSIQKKALILCAIQLAPKRRRADRTRETRHALEIKSLARSKDVRDLELKQIDRMLHMAEDLKSRVRESIEVLDEGHGNAIRVFTIVTVIFLPL